MNILKLNISADIDICQLFQHFSTQHWACLLDSANSPHQDARFDIFAASPVSTLTTLNGVTRHHDCLNNHITEHHNDPLTLVQQQLQHIFGSIPFASELPFVGGALGFLSYDLGRQFEILPELACDDYHSPQMAIGIYTWAVIKDHQRQQWLLVSHPDFNAPSANELELLATTDVSHNNPFLLTSAWQSNMTPAQYSDKFAQVQQHLLAGDCYQVNLSQRFKAQYQGDEWLAYLRLRNANKAPFSAFIRLPEACVLSISPERFIAVDKQQVQTRPIKGTRPRQTDAQADDLMKIELRQSAKDQAENLMIVDLLRNDLSKSCVPGSVKVPQLFGIESFPAVHHLVSTIVGELQVNQSPLDLIRGAFPGGSITGAPKIRAMEIIEALEPHRRNIYCGSIGYISHNRKMDTNICIRTLLCENGNIYCWAGGGLVVDSEAEAEYQETYHKVDKILPVLSDL